MKTVQTVVVVLLVGLFLFPDLAQAQSFRDVLDELNEKNRKELRGKTFTYQFYADISSKIDEYQSIQSLLAEKIPHEYDRPIFEIKMDWGDANCAGNSIGILGGMGPLSDAHLISLINRQLQKASSLDCATIYLLSMPPPRTWWEIIRGGLPYMLRLLSFFDKPLREIYLASNTAHTYQSYLSLMPKASEIANLPERLVRTLSENPLSESTLIIATQSAYDKRLYSKLLKKHSVAYVRVSPNEQLIIQSWIDKIKRGEISQENARQLQKYLEELAVKYETRTLLLGCTELPLLLKALPQKFQTSKLSLIDSEYLFARFITQDLLKLGSGKSHFEL